MVFCSLRLLGCFDDNFRADMNDLESSPASYSPVGPGLAVFALGQRPHMRPAKLQGRRRSQP